MIRDSQDGALSRWSRRKTKARAGDLEQDPQEAVSDSQLPAEGTSSEDDRPDSEILEDLGLPDPDTLQEGDNFKAFLRSEVPARLRRRALARLWRSHPLLATVDDLVEYGEDYTDAATVVENLQTVYQVGRGMLVPEPDPPDTPDVPAAPAEAAEGTSDEDGSVASDSASPDSTPAEDDSPPPAEAALPDAAEPPSDPLDSPPRPRRESMQFRFDGGEA